MDQTRVFEIKSPDALRGSAASWDDLWWRSDTTLPMARAELVAQWLESFAAEAEFRALVVEQDGKWMAALPLAATRVHGLLSGGTMPVNDWAYGGGLLLDPHADAAVVDALVGALRALPWQLLWLDWAPLESPHWQAFRRGLERADIGFSSFPRYQIGYIKINQDWEGYQKQWSGKHRSQMRSRARRLEREGKVCLNVRTPSDPESVEGWLRRGFEVEDRSWKGEAGTSVLRRGMFPFLVQQGMQLAAWNQLQLVFLELNGKPIAFAHHYLAKGVAHNFKNGYDAKYASFGPGHLLHYYFFQHAFSDPSYRGYDFLGEVTDAISAWRPDSYPLGQLLVAPKRLLGRLAVHAHQHWWPPLRRLKGRLVRPRPQPSSSPSPPAEEPVADLAAAG